MDEPGTRPDPPAPPRAPTDRLDSWKKIAAYLKRDVTTVQRWERREEMPVHRHLHDKQGSVFAYRSELDAWWQSRRVQLAPPAGPASAQQPPPAAATGPAPPRRAGGSRLRLGVLLAVVALAGIAAWLGMRGSSAWHDPFAEAKFSRLSAFEGTEQSAAISPDGRFVAFLASRDGQLDAWVGRIGSGVYHNFTQGTQAGLANPSVRALGFSADSSLVSVWTRKGDGSQPQDVIVYAAPTNGGPLRPYLPGAAEFDWSRDGRLVYHTTAPGDPLYVRERGATVAHEIYAATAGVHCHYPLWSTDGAFIYFVRGVPAGAWDIWRIRPSGAGLERLTHHDARVTYPVMLDPRTLVYLVTEADGSGPWIYGLDPEHPQPRRLTPGLETYTSLAASADGMRLVATTARPRSSLWRVPLAGAASAAPERRTLLAADGLTPRFGPGFLVFQSARSGQQGIWTLTQGVAREIWHDARVRITGAPTVSPDGSRIAFTVDDGTRSQLLAMNRDGTQVTVVNDSLRLKGNPAWSPDGQSIVSAALYGAEPRLTRIFLNAAPSIAMVGEYSTDPVWSPDGRFVVYSGPDVGTTFAVRAAAPDGRAHAMPSLILTRGARRVAIVGEPAALVLMRGDLGHKDLWAVDLQTGHERQLTTLPPDFAMNDFDVSADGTELVLGRLEENSDLALIERQSSRFGLPDASPATRQ